MTRRHGIAELVEEWRGEAQLMSHRGLAESAALVESLANDLEETLRGFESDLLNLQESAAHSGYSPGHLSRLVRDGEILNRGRPGAPRIRRSDLPIKCGHLTKSTFASDIRESKAAIVRSIADQGTGDGTNE